MHCILIAGETGLAEEFVFDWLHYSLLKRGIGDPVEGQFFFSGNIHRPVFVVFPLIYSENPGKQAEVHPDSLVTAAGATLTRQNQRPQSQAACWRSNS